MICQANQCTCNYGYKSDDDFHCSKENAAALHFIEYSTLFLIPISVIFKF